MMRAVFGMFGLLALLAGPAAAQTGSLPDDRRVLMQRDLTHRQTLLSQQEARVREAENNVVQARQSYDQLVAKGAASPKPTSAAPSGLKPAGGGGGDATSQAYKALDSATYKLNVLRADERNLRESVKVLREALSR